MAFLTPEQLRAHEDYIPTDGKIVHVDATLKLMEAITGDTRFKDAMNDLSTEEKESVTMYNIIDGYINRGREEARKAYETVLAEKDRAMMEKDLTISRMAQELRELKLQYGIA